MILIRITYPSSYCKNCGHSFSVQRTIKKKIPYPLRCEQCGHSVYKRVRKRKKS